MKYDLIVYRATPAGIMAAVTAARLDLKTLVIEPDGHVGGAMTSGLNATDVLDDTLITGLPREFFERVSEHYSAPKLKVRTESKVAGSIFSAMLRSARVRLWTKGDIKSVQRNADKLFSCVLTTGEVATATWWIDASYEGDLIAKAGLSCALGRESSATYDEPWAGVQQARAFLPWQERSGGNKATFDAGLSYAEDLAPREIGMADDRVQSYCVRITLTNHKTQIVPITAPEDFDFGKFDFLRTLARGTKSAAIRSDWYPALGLTLKSGYFNLAEIANGKYDLNSGPLAPTNNPALTHGWVTATPEKRREMNAEFIRYSRALLYFMQNDKHVPYAIRAFLSDFGLPGDEYETSGHFPPYTYVREGRRLIGDKVFTQNDIMSGGVPADQAICAARYLLDSKPVIWMRDPATGHLLREGMFISDKAYSYALPSWVILPKRKEATNLFSVCGVSASHVAFGSIRMEPTWMELGSAAALIAKLAGQSGRVPHDVTAREVRSLRDSTFGKPRQPPMINRNHWIVRSASRRTPRRLRKFIKTLR